MSSLITSILSTLTGAALIGLCALALARIVSQRRPGADVDALLPPPISLPSPPKPLPSPPSLPSTPPCFRPSPTLRAVIPMTLADYHRSIILEKHLPTVPLAPKKKKKKKKKKKSVRIDLARNTLHTFPPNNRQFGVHWHRDKSWVVYHHELDPAGYDTLHAGRTRYPKDVPDVEDLCLVC